MPAVPAVTGWGRTEKRGIEVTYSRPQVTQSLKPHFELVPIQRGWGCHQKTRSILHSPSMNQSRLRRVVASSAGAGAEQWLVSVRSVSAVSPAPWCRQAAAPELFADW